MVAVKSQKEAVVEAVGVGVEEEDNGV